VGLGGINAELVWLDAWPNLVGWPDLRCDGSMCLSL
jgi:hypothetical protein